MKVSHNRLYKAEVMVLCLLGEKSDNDTESNSYIEAV